MVAKGESDGRHSFQASLYHNAHRTGIMQVYRRIVAVVDAAYHQVGLAVEHRMKASFTQSVGVPEHLYTVSPTSLRTNW